LVRLNLLLLKNKLNPLLLPEVYSVVKHLHQLLLNQQQQPNPHQTIFSFQLHHNQRLLINHKLRQHLHQVYLAKLRNQRNKSNQLSQQQQLQSSLLVLMPTKAQQPQLQVCLVKNKKEMLSQLCLKHQLKQLKNPILVNKNLKENKFKLEAS